MHGFEFVSPLSARLIPVERGNNVRHAVKNTPHTHTHTDVCGYAHTSLTMNEFLSQRYLLLVPSSPFLSVTFTEGYTGRMCARNARTTGSR